MTKTITCLTCGLDLADEASDCECDTERTLLVVDDEETVALGQTAEIVSEFDVALSRALREEQLRRAIDGGAPQIVIDKLRAGLGG